MIYLVAVVVGFVIFLLFFVVYWHQVIGRGITRHFHAAEIIAEGYLPPTWARMIDRRLWWRRMLPLSFRPPPTGTELALAKLDEVALFFLRNSTFVDPAAKKLLIAQLKEARFRWQALPWDTLRQQLPPTSGK